MKPALHIHTQRWPSHAVLSLRRCVYLQLGVLIAAELQTEFLWLHAGNGCAQFTSISAINSALNAPNGRTDECMCSISAPDMYATALCQTQPAANVCQEIN
jgi:hypothetical protein